YMEEAERLCDRIGIIDEGHLVAEGTRAELVHRITQRTRIKLSGSGPLAEVADRVRALDGVGSATVADNTLDLLVDDVGRTLGPIVEAADRADVAIGGVEVVEPDLEAVFLELTGKGLRD